MRFLSRWSPRSPSRYFFRFNFKTLQEPGTNPRQGGMPAFSPLKTRTWEEVSYTKAKVQSPESRVQRDRPVQRSRFNEPDKERSILSRSGTNPYGAGAEMPRKTGVRALWQRPASFGVKAQILRFRNRDRKSAFAEAKTGQALVTFGHV